MSITRTELPVTIDDIEDAARRLNGHAVRTPLLRSQALDDATGGRVFIKPETLQRTGSFKFRGAYNAISRLDAGNGKAGVVAFSSGNHAQGVAAAATLCGLPATIVMPSDAPAAKVARTKGYGAEVVLYDRVKEDRQAIAEQLTARRGAALIAPFDNTHVIAGQGTVGLEIAEDAQALGVALDDVLMPCSGGGLAGGIAVAFASRSPQTRVHAVEPEGFDDLVRSLASGKRERNDRVSGSICDALMSPEPGEITFAINSRLLAGAFAVSDGEVAEAMRFAWAELKLVVEPGGAVALAALLSRKLDVAGRTVGVVCSGANADQALYADVLAGKI